MGARARRRVSMEPAGPAGPPSPVTPAAGRPGPAVPWWPGWPALRTGWLSVLDRTATTPLGGPRRGRRRDGAAARPPWRLTAAGAGSGYAPLRRRPSGRPQRQPWEVGTGHREPRLP